MAITQVSVASNSGAVADPTVTIGSATVLADDLIIAYCGTGSQSTPVLDVTTAGYTAVCAALAGGGGFQDSLLVYKVAVGGEEDDVITFETDFSWSFVAGVVVLRGCDVSTIWDVTPTHGTYHVVRDNDTTPSCVQITTLTDGAAVVAVTHLEDTVNTVTAVSSSRGGSTDVMNIVDANGEVSGLMTWEEIASAGPIDNEHTYTSADTGADAHTMVVAIKPASAGGGPLIYAFAVG